jgi:hypothetical protein
VFVGQVVAVDPSHGDQPPGSRARGWDDDVLVGQPVVGQQVRRRACDGQWTHVGAHLDDQFAELGCSAEGSATVATVAAEQGRQAVGRKAGSGQRVGDRSRGFAVGVRS